MQTSTTAVLTAAGAAAVAGAIGVVAVRLLARRSPAWAVATTPAIAVLTVAAGVTAASLQMLLTVDQVRLLTAVLAISAGIALGFGIFMGRRVGALQQQAAEARSAREQEAQIEERRRELISWLSHDLRAPLARMQLLTEAAEDGLAPPDHTTRVLLEVDALNRIVADIATLSRLRGPMAPLDLQPTDLRDLASDAVAANQPLADRLQIDLIGGTSSAAPVSADPAEMTRALNNLIGNALRHTRPEGFVRVDTAPTLDPADGTTGMAQLVVTDQCGGIPPEHLPHLFEPGWRGTAARTPGDGGAGLGLAIANSVVQSHGGTITVANTNDGCAFTVRLPIALSERSQPVSR